MSDTVVIERRYRGPPDSANGGYACGVFAAFVPGPAEVTLRHPPPLDTELRIERDDSGSVRAMHGDQLVAEATTGAVTLDAPEPVPVAAAAAAAARSWIETDPHQHPFPTCFVCGPDREAGDGQRMFVGPVAGRDVAAAPWTPDERLPGRAGRVAPEIVWAVLDCAGGIGSGFGDGEFEPGPAHVLGRFTADIRSTPRLGDECVALGWRIAQDGRKLFAGSALYAAGGELLALARATWIELR